MSQGVVLPLGGGGFSLGLQSAVRICFYVTFPADTGWMEVASTLVLLSPSPVTGGRTTPPPAPPWAAPEEGGAAACEGPLSVATCQEHMVHTAAPSLHPIGLCEAFATKTMLLNYHLIIIGSL